MTLRPLGLLLLLLVLAAPGAGADPPLDPLPLTADPEQPATENSVRQLIWYTDRKRYIDELQGERQLFLLQVISISVGMHFGFYIFYCFLASRRMKMP